MTKENTISFVQHHMDRMSNKTQLFFENIHLTYIEYTTTYDIWPEYNEEKITKRLN